MKQATPAGIPIQPLSLTEARKVLGELPDAAFERPQPVRIQRGNRIVRLVPEVIPEPIEVIPEGALHISDERAAWLDNMPQETFCP
jgi:hypothetical protein